MLLSIIIPVYNGEKKIIRCLDSLKTISEKDIEFIIINDGSTDNTKIVCEGYIKRDNRFKLVNKDNTGVSSTRNKGIELAKGEYIGFVDADDEVTKDYDNVIEGLKNDKYDLYSFMYSNVINGEERKQCRDPLIAGFNNRRMLYNNFLTGFSNNVWSNIYRIDIIRRNHVHFPEEMRMGEDCVFNAQYIRYCANVYYIDKVAYKYYSDNYNSASYQKKLSYVFDYIKVYEAYINIYHMMDNLNFSFSCEHYLQEIYEILKMNRKDITKEFNTVLRESCFFYKIMSHRYDDWKLQFKKILIKTNMYVFFLP